MELWKRAELELCKRDRSRHFQNHFYIRDSRGDIRLFTPLKRAQRKLQSVLHYCRYVWMRPARVLVYKSRKLGMSTFSIADLLAEVLENGSEAIVIAQDIPTADYLLEIAKRFYMKYDLPRPTLARSNKREIRFDSQVGFIEVHTANAINSARGRTPQYILSDEVAFWEKGHEVAISLFNTLPNQVGTTHIMQSTPNGSDPLFKSMWENSEDYCRLTFDEKGEELIPSIDIHNEDLWNGFIPLYISAIEDEGNRLPLREDEAGRFLQTLDEYERSMVTKYNAPLEFLKWRRKKLTTECRGDVRILHQEFACSPEEGFVISGNPRFDLDKLNLMEREDGKLGYLKQAETWDRRISFVPDKQEFLTVFRSPIPSHNYIIGIDTAEGAQPEGARDPDRSVMIVLDIDEGGAAGHVATYASHVSEEYLVGVAKTLAEWYNNAYLVPETAGGHGVHLVEELKKVYPIDRIYHRMDSSGKAMSGDILGWRTHEGNRKQLIDRLAGMIADGAIVIRDRNTLSELREFKWTRKGTYGRYEAGRGHHDDHVIALSLAVMGMETYPRLPIQSVQEEIRKYWGEDRTGRSNLSGY